MNNAPKSISPLRPGLESIFGKRFSVSRSSKRKLKKEKERGKERKKEGKRERERKRDRETMEFLIICILRFLIEKCESVTIRGRAVNLVSYC